MKLTVKQAIFTRYELYTADECFLTGTAAEVIPVVKVDARVINGGKPGTVTKNIISAFHKVTVKDGVKVGTVINKKKKTK